MTTRTSTPAHPPASLLGAFFHADIRVRERGQGLVEYALILVLVAITAIGGLSLLGHQTSQVFVDISCTLGGGPTHVDQGNGKSNKCK